MIFLGNSTDTGEETACELFKNKIIRKIKGIDADSEEHLLVRNEVDRQEPEILSEEDVLDDTRHTELMS